MRTPKISVVTPSYNHARFIEATLRSVINSGYPNLEYIVVDGGSTDGTADIIRHYADRLAYWASEPDHGQTEALIRGFSHATGDIFAYLNSDDLYEPWTLREVGEFFLTHPHVAVVYGDGIWIDIDGHPIRPKKEHPFNRFIWLNDHNFIPQPSTFWRRTLYEKVGGLDPAFSLAMDADLFIRFAEVVPLHHVCRQWSQMRVYPEQKNQRCRTRSDFEDLVIRHRYGCGDTPAWSRKVKKVLAKSMRVGWKLVTGCYYWSRADGAG